MGKNHPYFHKKRKEQKEQKEKERTQITKDYVFYQQDYPIHIKDRCPFCGGGVVHTSNMHLYGKVYGNGMCFMCVECKASTGCHSNGYPLGVLSNKKMKRLKMECHDYFDRIWKSGQLTRSQAYGLLAARLNIKKKHCHFGYFNEEQLLYVLEILKEGSWINRGGKKP